MLVVLFSFIEEEKNQKRNSLEVLDVSATAVVDKGRCPLDPYKPLKRLDLNFYL